MEWEPVTRVHPLHRNILAVAKTRVEGAWAAYIDVVPGINHDSEYGDVLLNGNKLMEATARTLFPLFKDVPYAR